MGSHIAVGLDVGTTKVCALVAEVNGKGKHLLGIGTAPSKGMRKGMVVNIDSTVDSIKTSVAAAEACSGIRIKSVTVGISGSHVEGFTSTGVTGIRGKEVSLNDVNRAIDSAKAVYIPLDREVLHVMSMEFVLDGQGEIADPIGMSGVRLEARVHIITGAVSPVQNLVKCVERAGLDVEDIVFEPLASASSTVTKDEKEAGIVLVDIGGGTADIALFRDGSLRNVSVIGVGGAHITNDIAIGLRVNMNEAERLKKVCGSAVEGIAKNSSEEIQIRQTGDQERSIPRKYLIEIIQPRCEEMLQMIKREITTCLGYELATCGVILTGGCSLLNGFDTMAESVLGLPVRIGLPSNIKAINSAVASPVYATGAGLLSYSSSGRPARIFSPDSVGGAVDIMKEWIKGIFRIDQLNLINSKGRR